MILWYLLMVSLIITPFYLSVFSELTWCMIEAEYLLGANMDRYLHTDM